MSKKRRRQYKKHVFSLKTCKAKPITDVLSSGCWSGEPCCIIGGGSSAKDLDFEKINQYHTIGINKAFIKYPCDINYSMDANFYSHILLTDPELLEKWKDYKGLKVFLFNKSTKMALDSSIYYVNKIKKHIVSSDLETGIFGGTNSGVGALMLAIALGANPIYLFGFDMKLGDDDSTHWHDGYQKTKKEHLKVLFKKWVQRFEELAEETKKHNIKVVNCCLDSKLECFEKGCLL